MRAVNPPPNPAEVVRSQARGQLGPLNCTYDALWPRGPRNEAGDLGILEAFILRHPTTAATKEQAASHEAGHSIAHERLGMMMHAATINGPPFGRGGWGGTAQYRELFYGPWMGEWFPRRDVAGSHSDARRFDRRGADRRRGRLEQRR